MKKETREEGREGERRMKQTQGFGFNRKKGTKIISPHHFVSFLSFI
jgi:hypothetical protein